MKKLLLLGFLVIGLNQLNAQTVNDIPLKDIDQTYVQIVGTSGAMSNKVKIEIDFGQVNKFFSSAKDTQLRD